MEVRIGVVYTPREIILEMGDDADTVSTSIETAVREKSALLWLTDSQGPAPRHPDRQARVRRDRRR